MPPACMSTIRNCTTHNPYQIQLLRYDGICNLLKGLSGDAFVLFDHTVQYIICMS
jgi:hypothetical protein